MTVDGPRLCESSLCTLIILLSSLLLPSRLLTLLTLTFTGMEIPAPEAAPVLEL